MEFLTNPLFWISLVAIAWLAWYLRIGLKYRKALRSYGEQACLAAYPHARQGGRQELLVKASWLTSENHPLILSRLVREDFFDYVQRAMDAARAEHPTILDSGKIELEEVDKWRNEMCRLLVEAQYHQREPSPNS